ncbi:MAG: tRNA (adenosine(37)-N6)-threonylcarbamoyltransferase complex transferase subunit TsaD [Synergistaceae bacterium]|nr:tRNA (adenosine(37)-N6)-threonylcarbamoyltransferase complex transferase subunit TsaD [Synergistaceae bacterium]
MRDGKFITLGIETSCDDTALALLEGPRDTIYDVISSQTADHSPFGGVVPELASRKHQEAFLPLLGALFDGAGMTPAEIDLIAVTAGPGLMGSLLVGVMAAKALTQAWEKPIVGVNHLEGHIFANILAHPRLEPPFLCLIVSGGHTEIVLARGEGKYLLLGATRDDAAGEAYDKAAKALGLGYPGGPVIERLARDGDSGAFDFPIALRDTKDVEFSFSGLKTSLRTTVGRLREERPGDELPVSDICASFQRAVTESLMRKVRLAVKKTKVTRVAVSGGVAANSSLRDALSSEGRNKGWDVFIPSRKYCTDNATMIAAVGYSAFMRGERSDLSLTPDPSWEIWEAAG